MCDAIAIVGPGYKCPTYEEIRGPILQAEKKDINTRLEEFKQSWEISGCTLMSDGWSDAKGRTLLNFLVQCPKGTMFIKSVDASTGKRSNIVMRVVGWGPSGDWFGQCGTDHNR